MADPQRSWALTPANQESHHVWSPHSLSWPPLPFLCSVGLNAGFSERASEGNERNMESVEDWGVEQWKWNFVILLLLTQHGLAALADRFANLQYC